MNPQQILEDILLLDKSITISFPSRNQFNSFRSQLYIYKDRVIKKLLDIGMDDPFAGKMIKSDMISGASGKQHLTYRFYLGVKIFPAPAFQIIAIDELV